MIVGTWGYYRKGQIVWFELPTLTYEQYEERYTQFYFSKKQFGIST